MSEGRKDDTGKLRWDLLPWDELEDIVRVLTHGATEYGEYNWQKLDNARARYHAAAMRHIVAWTQGKHLDDKSRLPHLAHAACNLLFLAWFDNHEAQEREHQEVVKRGCATCRWCESSACLRCRDYDKWELCHG